MQNKLVTVFGGGGFVGRYVVQALIRAGARVRVAQRHPAQAFFLKGGANLGQIQFVAADVTRPETLARAVAGADGVINLVGSFANMDAVQGAGAGHVATAAKRAGVASLVHISAIGADKDSASTYGQSKGAGEAAVRKAFPGATIIAPSLIFGREDQFTNRFAALIRALPLVPVIRGDARFQPVYVGDVAAAIVAALADPEARGQRFALGGPQVLSMREINAWLGKATGHEKMLIDVPDVLAGAMARVTGWLPLAPMTWDQWLMLQNDNVVQTGERGLADLGLGATAMAAVAPDWLVTFRKNGRFGKAVSA